MFKKVIGLIGLAIDFILLFAKCWMCCSGCYNAIMQSCGVRSNIVTSSLVLLLQKKKDDAYYKEDCFKINATEKFIDRRSAAGTNLNLNYDLENDYDSVVAPGSTVNTFKIPSPMGNLLPSEGKITYGIKCFCIVLLFSWFDPKFKLF
jgi:hypothetical protein